MKSIRIEAPHFVAAVDLGRENGFWVVVHAAPILAYMQHWTPMQVFRYCQLKHWTAEVLE